MSLHVTTSWNHGWCFNYQTFAEHAQINTFSSSNVPKHKLISTRLLAKTNLTNSSCFYLKYYYKYYKYIIISIISIIIVVLFLARKKHDEKLALHVQTFNEVTHRPEETRGCFSLDFVSLLDTHPPCTVSPTTNNTVHLPTQLCKPEDFCQVHIKYKASAETFQSKSFNLNKTKVWKVKTDIGCRLFY